MAEVTYKTDENGIIELLLRFDKGLSQAAVISFLQRQFNMAPEPKSEPSSKPKSARTAALQGVPAPTFLRQARPTEGQRLREGDRLREGATSLTWTRLRKIVLVQLHRFVRDRGHGPRQAKDLGPYVREFREFATADTIKTGQKIRYVFRELEKAGLAQKSDDETRLTDKGAQYATQFAHEFQEPAQGVSSHSN